MPPGHDGLVSANGSTPWPSAGSNTGSHVADSAVLHRCRPDDLDGLEAWLGVGLPADYREFLTDVTSGGVGPHDGLRPVRRLEHGGWEWQTGYNDVDPDLLATPFPTLRMNDHTRMTLCGPPPFEEHFTDPDDFQRAFDTWADHANAGIWARDRTAGAIRIADRNIDMRVWLIVTGPGPRHHLERLARRPR